MNYLKYFIEFIVLFLICFLYYRLIAFKGLKKKKNSTKDKELPEVKLFIHFYKIDMNKVKYMQIAKQFSVVISIILSITVVLTIELSTNILYRIVICVVTLSLLTIISYKLLGFYYKKKGLVKDVQS